MSRSVNAVSVAWPEPKPLPSGLAPVQPFDIDFMPTALAPWIEDIAQRLQCPPDYVAVAAVTALGSSSVAGSVSSRRRELTGSRFRTSGAASSVDLGRSSRRR